MARFHTELIPDLIAALQKQHEEIESLKKKWKIVPTQWRRKMTETKIIVATFKTNQKETIVYGLWQYDYGQTLRIRGLQLPSVVQVHFALQELDGESVTEIGTTQNGVTDVKIPDGLLKKQLRSIYTIGLYIRCSPGYISLMEPMEKQNTRSFCRL